METSILHTIISVLSFTFSEPSFIYTSQILAYNIFLVTFIIWNKKKCGKKTQSRTRIHLSHNRSHFKFRHIDIGYLLAFYTWTNEKQKKTRNPRTTTHTQPSYIFPLIFTLYSELMFAHVCRRRHISQSDGRHMLPHLDIDFCTQTQLQEKSKRVAKCCFSSQKII